MGVGRLVEGLTARDPGEVGPYRLLARWPGPRPEPPENGMYLGRDRAHGNAVVCLLPPAAHGAAAALRRGDPVPGTAAVLDARTDIAPAWLALAYAPAVSLADLARPDAGGGVLPAEQAVRVAGAVADTLAGLHARGVGYGAVAPEGVWLTTGRPLLLALHACRTLTSPGGGAAPGAAQGEPEPPRRGPEPHSRVSTVPAAWMAPEVAAGGPSSAAADVYALAVLLLHTATGRLPFGDGPPPVLAYRAAHEAPVLPELPGLPQESGRAVAAALAPSPADRPTAAELCAALTPGGAEPAWAHGAAPGRVVAALAVRSQSVADLEAPDGRPAERAATAVATLPDGPEAGGRLAVADTRTRDAAPGPRTAQAPPPPTGTPAGPTRRRVLSGLLTGAAGAALGVGGALAWSGLVRDEPDGAPAPGARPGQASPLPRVSGMPPGALWRLDDATARTRLLPVSGAGRFLVARGDDVYGHDLGTGRQVWELPGAGESLGRPVAVPGDRALMARSGLAMVSLGDGRTQWLQRYEDLTTVLAVEGGTAWLLVGNGTPAGGNRLAAFDLERRRETWRTPLPDGFGYDLAVTVGPATVVVEVPPPDEGVFRDVHAIRTLAIAGFDRATGRMLWNRTYPEVYSGAASAVDPVAGRLFLLSREHAHAYDLTTGARLWESRAQVDDTNGPPLLAGGVLCVNDAGLGPLVGVASDTGRTLWEQSLDEVVEWTMLGPMVVGSSGRTVYLSTLHRVIATDLASGRRQWQVSLSGAQAREPFQLVSTAGVLLVARSSAVVAIPAD
ncbi:PQQ-binding-like beta-propeller repeat protein [Streptomyces sp. NPDC048606]|uniref:outer membrane protein assembly factor BamB family protein n=1 Tax=Streptomyces sp. NPDC048606 TaxID=3154726 RepID=UPI0034338BAB